MNASIRTSLSATQVRDAVEAYMGGLKDAFALTIALGAFATVVVIVGTIVDRRVLGKKAAGSEAAE